ncbi:MAG: sigma 54-interacting transcriptional regulator [Candidatus Latescibacterota bacterium]
MIKENPSDPSHPLRAEQTSVILDSVADGVFTIDMHWRITSFNRAAKQITGISRQEALGQQCWEVFKANICETGCALRQTLETGQAVVNRPAYILDVKGNRVPISISSALLKEGEEQVIGGVETFRDLSLVEELRRRVEQRYCCEDILSRNHRMQQLFELLPTIAASDSTVLIQGESGTGKELVARAIHHLSPRKAKSFVAIDCGALPDTLLESELFGYKAGAFTDARRDKPGRFRLAEGGTLFLDEIADVSAALQMRLLRVLQERVYVPLGGTQAVKANVRIVAASNKDLEELVQQGRFRQDLFYRINVIPLVLPPLRDRREDIPLLVDHFVARFNRLQGKGVVGVSEEALSILMAYDFPGNVRELENIVEHAFVLCGGGIIEPAHLPRAVLPAGDSVPSSTGGTVKLKEIQGALIAEVLRRTAGNRTQAARILGIHKSTLYRKVKALGIDLPAQDGRRPAR